MGNTLSELYLHEYPRLIDTLAHITTRVRRTDALPITLMVLFGSIVRLTPHQYSDTDVLILIAGMRDCERLDAHMTALVRIIRQAEDETVDEHYRWHIIPVLGDATATDLDPDFVETIGREGVLLYHAPGAIIPEPLRNLAPFEQWAERVRERLASLSAPNTPTR